VNNGKKTKFWEGIWIQDTALRDKFPRLYSCCRDKQVLVADCWEEREWIPEFRRSFGEEEVREWNSMLVWLADCQLNGQKDVVKWKLEKTGLYSTKSMHRVLSFNGATNRRLKKMWKSKTPLKLKVLLWLAFQNKL
jgi:hypothetical protein